MKYLLDTDIIVNHLRKRERIENYLLTEGCITSIINKAELVYGAYKSNNPKRSLIIVEAFFRDLPIEVININDDALYIFGKTKAHLEKEGQKLDDFDLLIASMALDLNLILVTKNVKHYQRIPGLTLFTQT